MFSGGGGDATGPRPGQGGMPGDVSAPSKYRGAQGLDPEFIKSLEKQFGFDKPAYVRFAMMIKNYLLFDFGQSYFRDTSVLKLIAERMPVSISLGLWMTLLSYAISIPLGIRKAVQDGSRFDVWTSTVIVIGYAIPGFLVAVFLIVLLAGGSFVQIFPLRGLVSENWHELSWPMRIVDYFWHLVLPMFAMALSAFATTTFLTKNSFLEEIRKQYVIDGAGQGARRAPGAVRACVPQRHADRHRRLSRRVHRRVLRRLAPDRDDLQHSKGSVCLASNRW